MKGVGLVDQAWQEALGGQPGDSEPAKLTLSPDLLDKHREGIAALVRRCTPFLDLCALPDGWVASVGYDGVSGALVPAPWDLLFSAFPLSTAEQTALRERATGRGVLLVLRIGTEFATEWRPLPAPTGATHAKN